MDSLTPPLDPAPAITNSENISDGTSSILFANLLLRNTDGRDSAGLPTENACGRSHHGHDALDALPTSCSSGNAACRPPHSSSSCPPEGDNHGAGKAQHKDIAQNGSPASVFALRSCDFGGGLCELSVVNAIKQYMAFHGLQKALQTLSNEVDQLQRPQNQARSEANMSAEGKSAWEAKVCVGGEFAVSKAMAKFDEGDRDHFFHIWDQLIPAGAAQGSTGCALELRLRVHFGILPARRALEAQADKPSAVLPPEAQPDLADLKMFLAKRQVAALEESAENLALLFALPFVPQPHTRAGLKFIFEAAWVDKLRADLFTFILAHAAERHAPTLRHLAGNIIICQGAQTAPTPANWNEVFHLACQGLSMAKRMCESQPLGGVRSGGVRALRNVKPSPDLLREISEARARLACLITQEQPRSSQPSAPAAGDAPVARYPEAIVASRGAAGVGLAAGQDRPWPAASEAVLSESWNSNTEVVRASPARRLSSARSLESCGRTAHTGRGLESRARAATALLPVPPGLDFGRMALVISGGCEPEPSGDPAVSDCPSQITVGAPPALSEVLKAVLRRMALPDEPIRPRRAFLAAFACFGALRALARRLHEIVLSEDSAFIEFALAVLAVSACESLGRKEIEAAESEVTVSHGCISTLISVLQCESFSTLAHMQCLAVLQRLSLRRQLQSKMIELGAINWLLSRLQSVGKPALSGQPNADDDFGAPDFSIEFTSALLVNLTLRSAGRKQCKELEAHTILVDFIEHPNSQVHTHINGTLYALLGVPSIRAAAQKQDMEAKFMSAHLRAVAQGSELLQKQLEFLTRQLQRHDGEEPESEEDLDAPSDPDDGDNFLEEEELAGRFILALPAVAGASITNTSGTSSAQGDGDCDCLQCSSY